MPPKLSNTAASWAMCRSSSQPSVRVNIFLFRASNHRALSRVMSSGMCKDAEGAVSPLKVKTVKNRVDDPVDASDVYETYHRPGSPSDLYKNTFDDVGGAQFPPQVRRKAEKVE